MTPPPAFPTVPDDFQWTQESWGGALRCGPLMAIAPHLFTTRQLELSGGDDERLLAEAVGSLQLAMLTQVHGNTVIKGEGGRGQEGRGQGGSRPEGDALVSDDPNVAIVVRAADCVPLLMADRRRGVVAAVHAGWRGTAAGVAVAAVKALERDFGSAPADLIVAMGPSIGPCCYEVGSELVDAFAAAGHARHLIDRWFHAPPPPRGRRERGRLQLDVAGANRDQLLLAGVGAEHIHMSGLCTAMHLDVFTSYRIEKERAGRLAGAIRAAK